MGRLSVQQLSEQKKSLLVGIVAAILIIVNVVPLHHFSRHNCPHGGTYTNSGTTMGLPLAYYQTWKGGVGDCAGFSGNSPLSGFSAQALVSNALVFGAVMVGANVLLDRRTRI